MWSTGNIYVFYDDGTGLSLQEAGNMKSMVVIGEKSLLTDYTYQKDIDQQTYNSIKLVQPNEETGRAEVYQMDDSETIGKWGLLRLYQQVDESLNSAQIAAQAQASLEYYNRPYKTLKISSLGVIGLRAGMMLLVNIPRVENAEKKYVLLEFLGPYGNITVQVINYEDLSTEETSETKARKISSKYIKVWGYGFNYIAGLYSLCENSLRAKRQNRALTANVGPQNHGKALDF